MSGASIKSLQAGRALAALAVVVHHAAIAARDFSGPFPASTLLEAGYLGVDFFFVLSGFIIYHSSQRKGLREYASARFRRVYLPYLPVGVGMALLYSAIPQLSAGDREWSWLPTLTLLPTESNTALSVAWTLKHEILFYGLFALAYFSGRLTSGVAVWGAAILGANAFGFGNHVALSLINLEFLFGIGVAVAYHRGWGGWQWYLLAFAALVLWLALGADRDESVLVGMAFAAAIIPTVGLERQGKIRVPAVLMLLGAASYAIYLVHGVAVSVAGRIAAGQHWSVVLALAIAAGVAAGLAYYWLIERPILLRTARKQPLRAGAPA